MPECPRGERSPASLVGRTGHAVWVTTNQLAGTVERQQQFKQASADLVGGAAHNAALALETSAEIAKATAVAR